MQGASSFFVVVSRHFKLQTPNIGTVVVCSIGTQVPALPLFPQLSDELTPTIPTIPTCPAVSSMFDDDDSSQGSLFVALKLPYHQPIYLLN